MFIIHTKTQNEECLRRIRLLCIIGALNAIGDLFLRLYDSRDRLHSNQVTSSL